MTFREIEYLNIWGITKRPRFRSKGYLQFTAELKCLICGSAPQCSHTIPKSAGNKGGDALVLPLCFIHHLGTASIHSLGIAGFQDWYCINLNHAIIMCWTLFLLKHQRDINVELAGLETRDAVLSKMESLITELA